MKANPPSFARTSTLVSRVLGLTPEELRASFRPAGAQDLPALIELRRRILGDALTWDDRQYLLWRYDFEGRPDSPGRVMVAAHAGKLLGVIGAERVRLARGSEVLDAVSLMDIMVQPELDGSGLGIWMNMAIFETHPIVIEIGANENSLGLINRLFHRLPDRKVYVAPLRFSRFLRNRLPLPTLGGVLALPANAAAKLWRAAAYRPRPRRWYFHEITEFDASVERLYASRWAPNEYSFVRSRRYLNWRLFRNPRATYHAFGAWENGELMAYAAYQSARRNDGQHSIRLVDWLVHRRYGLEGFATLIRELQRRAEAAGADIVSVTPLHALSEGSLLRLGFIGQSPHEFNTVGVRCSQPDRATSLYDGAQWFLTEANTDLDGLA
jgi:hypothetical protein